MISWMYGGDTALPHIVKEKHDMTTAKTAKTTKDAVELKRCACGCNAVVKNQFAQGHDAKLKSRLLRAFDRGSKDAGEDLVHRGWRTAAELAERRARAEAKAEKAGATKVARREGQSA